MIAPRNRYYMIWDIKTFCVSSFNCAANILIVKSILQDTKSEVEAKKLIKCIIKIVIKLGILYSNEKLSPNEKMLLKQMIRNFSKLIMTLVTFWEVREFRTCTCLAFHSSLSYYSLSSEILRKISGFISVGIIDGSGSEIVR